MVCLFQLHASFAVALLSLLGVASIIGTVLQQNQPQVDYLVKFGPFWSQIFGFLGLVRRVRLGMVRCHHDVFGDFHRIVLDSQCAAVFARDSFLS